MKTIKNILIGLVVIVVVMLVVAFFLPREVHVERSGSINAPAKVVFNQVNNLRVWEKWAVWNQLDPRMDIQFENTGIGKNASYTWSSENPDAGQGKLTITESVPYDSIATELNFMEQGPAMGYFLFDEKDGVTKITWALDTDLGWNPIARWMGLMFDRMLGPDFEEGIANLKVVSETIVQENRPVVEIVRLPEFNYVSLRQELEMEDISDQMGIMYGQLMDFMNKKDLSMSNMPYARYHQMDGTLIDLECGIPVNKTVDPQGNILTGTSSAKTCANADHIGPYNNLERTHSFIQQWIEDNDFDLAGAPMERYLTDPMQEPDESKWVTVIYYPVR